MKDLLYKHSQIQKHTHTHILQYCYYEDKIIIDFARDVDMDCRLTHALHT